MPEAQCVRYPIKPGQRDALVSWVKRLEERSTEMTQAMAELGFMGEAVFIERSDDGDHVLIYTSAMALPAVNEALATSRLPLVREFDQLLAETVELEGAVTLEFIYHTP